MTSSKTSMRCLTWSSVSKNKDELKLDFIRQLDHPITDLKIVRRHIKSMTGEQRHDYMLDPYVGSVLSIWKGQNNESTQIYLR